MIINDHFERCGGSTRKNQSVVAGVEPPQHHRAGCLLVEEWERWPRYGVSTNMGVSPYTADGTEH